MNKTKWYAKPIYALVALALVLSLGIMAVPMAGTVEAATPIYVNGATGNVAWDGEAPVWDGTHGPKKTILAGINVVDPGGTVHVAAGTYNLSTTLIISKAVTISGPETGDPAIIDGSTLGTSTDIVSITANNVTLRHMDVTAGLDNVHGRYLVYINKGHDAHIEYCKLYGIEKNLIRLEGADGAIIDHCEIYDSNEQIIQIKSGDTIKIKNSIIQHGDGIWLEGGSNIVIEQNLISGLHIWPRPISNTPFPYQNALIGILAKTAGSMITKNRIYAFSQAGIKLEAPTTIENNTIAFCYDWKSGNPVPPDPMLLQAQAEHAKYSFGIRISDPGVVTVKNNILAYNYRNIGIYPGKTGPDAASTIAYNDVYGGDVAGLTTLELVHGVDWKYQLLDDVVAGYDWDAGLASINLDWQTGHAGNISSDPKFVDVGNPNPSPYIDENSRDFHLQSPAGSYHGGAWTPDAEYSSCIDAGDPSSDFSKEPLPNGGRINMGAYGNKPQTSKTYEVGNLKILKYNDLNQDSHRDAGEGGLSGWEFTIVSPGGTYTETTDADGIVTLNDIPVGDCTITETLKPGWVNTDPGGAAPYGKTTTVIKGETTMVAFGNYYNPPPPPVGGEAYPVNKLGILTPWIGLVMAITAGSLIVIRRRKAQR